MVVGGAAAAADCDGASAGAVVDAAADGASAGAIVGAEVVGAVAVAADGSRDDCDLITQASEDKQLGGESSCITMNVRRRVEHWCILCCIVPSLLLFSKGLS